MTILDPVCGALAAAGVLAGLALRERTGAGCYVDNSMLEAAVALYPEAALAGSAGLPAPRREGAHNATDAPHNVYRCAGDDEWVAIAVTGYDGWQALRTILGLPDEPRFRATAGRLEFQDDLDAEIAAAVCTWEKQALAVALQAAGVAAAPVLNMRETYSDPHLRARRLLDEVEHPGFGVRSWFRAFAGRLEGLDLPIPRRPPALGEHNREILQGELGVSDEAFEALWAAEVIGDTPVAEMPPRTVDLAKLAAYEEIAEFDPDYRQRQRL
jgi:crotonobetainyl-CoA:carnitine CoA-transferase CaiB-like acyl-CoA transferase